MLASQILSSLSHRLSWMVMFRIEAIRNFADNETIKKMYFIPESVDLNNASYVVLSSLGRSLAPKDGSEFILLNEGNEFIKKTNELSLGEKFKHQLSILPQDEADCLGIGFKSGASPAFLHVNIGKTSGKAFALLSDKPSLKHYDLLPVIGVDFLGGESSEHGYIAHFRNKLSHHIQAGRLSGFQRTENCNSFFFEHAVINDFLADGLKQAFADRLLYGRRILRNTVRKLAEVSSKTQLAMTCIPPSAEEKFSYGDLVPLGFLLRGIKYISDSCPEDSATDVIQGKLAEERLQQHLNSHSKNMLWPFHRDRLVTATDSALVMLGLHTKENCDAIEVFYNKTDGGYIPQLTSEISDENHMTSASHNRHWQQSDYATTCLIRGTQMASLEKSHIQPDYLRKGFDTRSGLFFANPYLVDWSLALAIENDEKANQLKGKLLNEVLQSANEDGSYGKFDRFLSTALAIATLAALGYRGRALRLAQIRLLNFIDEKSWPVNTPFYSTFINDELEANKENLPTQHITCNGYVHEVYFYQDTHQIITAGVAAIALSINCDIKDDEPELLERNEANIHPRYKCPDIIAYITEHALPPYLSKSLTI